MRKRISLATISMAIITIALFVPLFTPTVTGQVGFHYKVILAQKYCNVAMASQFTVDGTPVEPVAAPWIEPPFYFMLLETGLGKTNDFVYTKIVLLQEPNDFHITLYIDWNQDGAVFEDEQSHQFNAQSLPPFVLPEPFVFQKPKPVQFDGNPEAEVFVAVVPEEPVHEWQITVNAPRGLNVTLGGALTFGGTQIAGFGMTTYLETETLVACYPFPRQGEGVPYPIEIPTGRQCVVLTTPECTVANDWGFQIWIDYDYPPNGFDYTTTVNEPILQFPHKWTDPSTLVTVEITQVQNYRFLQMGGITISSGMLDASVMPWPIGAPIEPMFGATLPYATRLPYLSSSWLHNNITMTQADPITGLVELSVPGLDWRVAPDDPAFLAYRGIDHFYFSPRLGTWLEVMTSMYEQGYGWVWTGTGKNPEVGQMDVDIITFGNDTGVYFLGPDGLPRTNDDIFISGKSENYALPLPGSAQWISLCGPDGVPGTYDDPAGSWGDGTPDPPGSAIIIQNALLSVWILKDVSPYGLGWYPLFQQPWPQPFTTGKAEHFIFENNSECLGAPEPGYPYTPFDPLDPTTYKYPSPPYPDHTNTTWILNNMPELPYRGHGEPMEFLHSQLETYDNQLFNATFKHPKSNVYMRLTQAWSCMNINTTLSQAQGPHPGTNNLDSFFITEIYSVREDQAVYGDANENQQLDGIDYSNFGASWVPKDEIYPVYTNATGFPPWPGPFDARFDFNHNGQLDGIDYSNFGACWTKKITFP